VFRAWASEQTGFQPVPRMIHTYHRGMQGVNFYRLPSKVTGLVVRGLTARSEWKCHITAIKSFANPLC
jgi:hypothetical protein